MKRLLSYILLICFIFIIGCKNFSEYDDKGVVAYIEEMLGEPKGNDEEYHEKANQLLDNLVEENEDKIQIPIK